MNVTIINAIFQLLNIYIYIYIYIYINLDQPYVWVFPTTSKGLT